MTPDQALQILDRASALAALPRQDHVAVQQALDVIRQAIAPAAGLSPKPPARALSPDPSPCG